MLPTFVIGLREGLEAALVVSIIATFLRRNNVRLTPMWVGAGLAVAVSIGVGVALTIIERALPQAEQEGMETVIGAVAVVFVTGMIVWMGSHARYMKRDLEGSAQAALSNGTAWALAVMVFLAVLKEGFETSVFILATVQASNNAAVALIGALLGVLAAVAIGVGLFTGGIRLNLAKFFTATSVFLIFVAAGLVLSALRTGHEAGWITIGQQPTVDLSWLAPNGSIRAALITGVLGIPADPRVIEALGWALYLVPMLLWTLWPKAHRPSGWTAVRLQQILGGLLVATAIVLAVAVRPAAAHVPTSAPLADGGTARVAVTGDTAKLTVARNGNPETTILTQHTRAGAQTHWQLTAGQPAAGRPATVDADTLVKLNGGRLPVGIDVRRAPGPYQARWTDHLRINLTTRDGGIVDASQTGRTLVALTGGGLTSPRVVQVSDDRAVGDWQVSNAYRTATATMIDNVAVSAAEVILWRVWLPIVLALAGMLILARGERGRRRLRAAEAAIRAETVPASAVQHAGQTT
ncbi:iron uptake transporter permease EfeU [Microlunatus sp. Gsoil 973]|uniref:iron uptake transporter permease EfeU n=1 Tax=Microlunatus sp. Gsoil 973 TaxID=2672569 RepID=UPI0012B4534B|nr:iron uptake transporter permease EfeU [Microlunatus sp. Gsoil 973]QGN34218.1 ferrous iron transporter [Microlunatus sp. Gsoil 973]